MEIYLIQMKTEKEQITFEYSTTSGSTTVSVYSGVNEGLDMSATFTVELADGTRSESILVKRQGRREKFNASDGAFITSDGSTFNVIKAIFSNGI